ncbi:hypothetical protein CBS63078_7120 [Aspergillus niger]|nr:hypothetical protein CBS63078_7120 [Aspergillus niger]
MTSSHILKACLWLLCFLANVSVVLTQAPPEITEAPQLIHARTELTYWQNWASIGGSYLTGIAAIGGAAAAYIAAKSSAASCATTIYILESSKRSDEPIGVEAMSINLAESGYVPIGEWYHHDNGTQTFEGFFSNGEVRIDNVYVSGNHTGGHLSLERTTSTAIDKRTTWAHKKVAFEYHSHVGVCKTRLTKAQLKEAAEKQLTQMSNNKDKCSCWTYTGGHGWYGEVKFMEIYDGDVMSGACYERKCNAT